MKLRAQSFTLDGEACVCGPDERTLPVGAVARLDQGEESGQPGDDPGAGSGVVRRRRIGILRSIMIAGQLGRFNPTWTSAVIWRA
jgi:hypothetical protein